jgi:two-component system CheB/CheR fusion protein
MDPRAIGELLRHLTDGGTLSVIVMRYGGRRARRGEAELPSSPAVREALPGVPLEAGRVYFVRQDLPVVLKGAAFAAAPAGRRGPAAPLSRLFASLAEELGPRATAVMLSGISSGGEDGLRAIKEKGGTILVQDPGTALFDEAPRAAIAAGVVDQVLSLAAIARELARLGSGAEAAAPLDDHPSLLDAADDRHIGDDALRRILSLLKARFRIDLGHYKLTTIRRRVERRMALSRFDSLGAYADHLRAEPQALDDLHDELFVHVTQFFRNPESFQALKERVFPALLKDRSGEDAIRIWVPGCSTGEEAYSIAMALTEFLDEQGSTTRIQLFATDVGSAAIQYARRATYSGTMLREVGPARLERFFESVGDGYRIRKELRELCVISQHDVGNNPPFSRLDLLSCRNVLIYFGAELQRRIIPILHYALRPGGFLWLGQSETPGSFSRLFSLVDRQHKIYSKIPIAADHLQLAPSRFTAGKVPLARIAPREAQGDLDFQRSADQLVLFKYGPPGVIINDELEILQYRGKTAPFLQPAPGQPTHSLLKMAHPDLSQALRSLVQSAKKQDLPVRKEQVAVDAGGSRRVLNVEVAPLNPLAPGRERQFLVLFEEASGRAQAPAWPAGLSARGRAGKRPRRDARDRYVEQLQQELDALRAHQQSLAEQFESAQEELTAANEELQATNEEFQSTIEELEAAKEGLQSANEELTTTNDELHSRNAELHIVNEKLARGEDRFRLMVEGVKEYAIYMLDPEGHVTSWNEGARRLTGYEAVEILGQHCSRFFSPEDVAARMPEAELEGARIEGRFEAEAWRIRRDGSRFWANVVVTRMNDSSGALVGFSKVIRDLTERKRSEEELERTERRFRQMISGVRDYAIFMLDADWRVASWNEGARRLKGYEEPEILGKHFSVFYPAEDRTSGRIEREIEAVMADGRVEDEGWRIRKDGTRFWANVVITRVTDPQGNLLGFTKVTRDLSERRNAEERLRRANESLELRVRDRTRELEEALAARDQFLSIASHELKTPLTGLKLKLQLARRNLDRVRGASLGPEQLASTFDRALRQAMTLEELVDDLLDISRIQTGRFDLERKEVDVGRLVEDVVARFTDQAAQARSTIELDGAPGVSAFWDERRITQVLGNLLSNAIRYAPGCPIGVAAVQDGALARIEVRDQGPGISEERHATIFERFERAGASASVGGLGLGLFIARRIVEAHGGGIRVESSPGAGARFIVELPLAPAQPDVQDNIDEKILVG